MTSRLIIDPGADRDVVEVSGRDRWRSSGDDEVEPFDVPFEEPEDAWETTDTENTEEFSERTESPVSPVPLLGVGSGAVSVTAGPEGSGAVDHAPRRIFPAAIPIPVSMTVATPPVEARPPIQDIPFASNSVRAPVTWSPRPAVEEPPRWATQSWRATSSVAARVSAIELPGRDDPRQRGLMIAAGAGLVIALAVAARR